MTAETLLDCIGIADEKYIAEAENYSPNKKRVKIIPYISAAACFAVIAISAALFLNRESEIPSVPDVSVVTSSTGENNVTENTVNSESIFTGITENSTVSESVSGETEITTAPTQISETAETAIVPHWEEISERERYTELKYKDKIYCISQAEYDENNVEFIENGEVYGMDEYTGEIKTKSCGYFKIENISDDYMIAVLNAEGKYTAYYNRRYSPETLSEFLDGTDFFGWNDLITIQGADSYDEEANAAYSIHYEIPDVKGFARNFLTDNSGARFVNSNEMFIPVLIIADEKTGLIQISDKGYVHLGTMPAGYYYDIGEEAVEELYNYLEKNAESKKVFYSSSGDENIPE